MAADISQLSSAGKWLTSWLSFMLCFVTLPNVSWLTSESRVSLAPLNWFKPSSKIFYWPFQGGTSFVDLLCFCSVLCLLCFVRVCLYVLRGHLLGKGWPLGSRLWCLLWVCHFPIGILGQVWYLIASIPDLCNLTYYNWKKILLTNLRDTFLGYLNKSPNDNNRQYNVQRHNHLKCSKGGKSDFETDIRNKFKHSTMLVLVICKY